MSLEKKEQEELKEFNYECRLSMNLDVDTFQIKLDYLNQEDPICFSKD